MTDTLEMSVTCGLALEPRRAGEPELKPDPSIVIPKPSAFEAMIENWYAVTYILNNLNRGVGLPDGYPFVLSSPVIEKLRFVHETMVAQVAPPQAGLNRSFQGKDKPLLVFEWQAVFCP